MNQDSRIITPAPMQATSRIINPRGTIAGNSGWTLLTRTDQASDAISDPAAITTGVTGFNRQTGVFSVQTLDTGVALLDGIRDNVPLWTMRLADLYPQFDLNTDQVDIFTVIDQMPLNTAGYGPIVGICDDVVANRATWVCSGFSVAPTSATAIQAGIIGATTPGTTTGCGSNTNPTTAFSVRVQWYQDSTHTSRLIGQAWRASADQVPLTGTAGGNAAFSSTAVSLWRLSFGVGHFSANQATANVVKFRIYHRLVRMGSATAP